MPTSKFNMGSKHKENSSMHAKNLFLKTLLIQLKEEVTYNINELPPQQAVEAHVVVTC
jgi:hypothetical protein